MKSISSKNYNINKKYIKDIEDFCKLNNIEDLEFFINKCFKKGFDAERYGLLGENSEKIVEVEVIREKRIEVPVEVIREIEKIVEIPVEVVKEIVVEKEVIKEVPIEKVVEKIVNIYDKNDNSELLLKIQSLENEMSKKDEELDEVRRNLDELRHSKSEKNNDNKFLMLQETLTKLRKEIIGKDLLIKELEEKNKNLESIKINQGAIFLKGSNLSNNL